MDNNGSFYALPQSFVNGLNSLNGLGSVNGRQPASSPHSMDMGGNRSSNLRMWTGPLPEGLIMAGQQGVQQSADAARRLLALV